MRLPPPSTVPVSLISSESTAGVRWEVLRRPRQTCAVHRNAAGRIVESTPFVVVVVATIAVNAVVLGLQTYDEVVDRWGDLLLAINAACVGVFIVELLFRIASYWPRPWEFFRNGWNVFDFVVVGATFVPGVAENSTLLRLVRLLRIVRIVRVLPELRVLLRGVWKSVPPLASIGAVTAMILFVYGMVGGCSSPTTSPSSGGTSAARC